MTGDFEVRGSQDLALLAKRLKEAGAGDLRKKLLAAIRTSGKKAIPDIQRSASSTLPHRGGLAARIAGQRFAVRTSLAVSGGSVRLVGQGMKELADINRGRLRHPVFGNREAWSAQSVTPGFFTTPIVEKLPTIRHDIREAIDEIAHQIGRGI